MSDSTPKIPMRWDLIGARRAQLAARLDRGGTQFFNVNGKTCPASDPGVIRPVMFVSKANNDGRLDREIGSHFGLSAFGGTEHFKEKGEAKTRKVESIRCPVLSHGQYADDAVVKLLRELADRDRKCNELEMDLLGQYCPMCAQVEYWRTTGRKEDEEMAKRMKRNPAYLINAVNRREDKEHPGGTLMLSQWSSRNYQALIAVISNALYQATILDPDCGRDLSVGIAGEGFAATIAITPHPRESALGIYGGKIIDLTDSEWANAVLRCWTPEDITTIIHGGDVQRPDRSEQDDKAPKPRCYNRGMKVMTEPQCMSCSDLKTCDTPGASQATAASSMPAAPSVAPTSLRGSFRPTTTGAPSSRGPAQPLAPAISQTVVPYTPPPAGSVLAAVSGHVVATAAREAAAAPILPEVVGSPLLAEAPPASAPAPPASASPAVEGIAARLAKLKGLTGK